MSESVASARRAVAIWQAAADAYPAVTSVQSNVSFGLFGLGQVALESGQVGRGSRGISAGQGDSPEATRALIPLRMPTSGVSPRSSARSARCCSKRAIRIGPWRNSSRNCSSGASLQGLVTPELRIHWPLAR